MSQLYSKEHPGEPLRKSSRPLEDHPTTTSEGHHRPRGESAVSDLQKGYIRKEKECIGRPEQDTGAQASGLRWNCRLPCTVRATQQNRCLVVRVRAEGWESHGRQMFKALALPKSQAGYIRGKVLGGSVLAGAQA